MNNVETFEFYKKIMGSKPTSYDVEEGIRMEVMAIPNLYKLMWDSMIHPTKLLKIRVMDRKYSICVMDYLGPL